MASKSELRLWSHSTWPSDEFTKQENKADLELHEADNRDHSAYGYMLYDSKKQYCYGSLYLNPIETLKNNYDLVEGTPDNLSQLDARIDMWVRPDEPQAHMELTFIIVDWLAETWKIKAGYVLRENMETKKQAYLTANLSEKLVLQHKAEKNLISIYGH